MLAGKQKTLFVFPYFIGDTILFKMFLDAWLASTETSPADITLVFANSNKPLMPLLFDAEGFDCLFFTPETWWQERQQTDSPATSETALLAELHARGPFNRLIALEINFFQPWCEAFAHIFYDVEATEKRLYVFLNGSEGQRAYLFERAKRLVNDGTFQHACLVPTFDAQTGQNRHMLEAFSDILADMELTPPPFCFPRIQLQDVQDSRSIDFPYVVIQLGASSPYKKVSVAVWLQVSKYLLSIGFHIVFTGYGLQDEKDQQTLSALLQNSDVDMGSIHLHVNMLTMEEVLQMIRNAAFILSNDTGVAHLAHVLGVKVLVIAMALAVDVFFPYPNTLDRPTSRLLYARPSCPVCGQACTNSCSYYNAIPFPCVASIQADDIMASIADWFPAALKNPSGATQWQRL